MMTDQPGLGESTESETPAQVPEHSVLGTLQAVRDILRTPQLVDIKLHAMEVRTLADSNVIARGVPTRSEQRIQRLRLRMLQAVLALAREIHEEKLKGNNILTEGQAYQLITYLAVIDTGSREELGVMLNELFQISPPAIPVHNEV